MSINVRVEDGTGTGNAATVNNEGQLNVIVHPHPPVTDQKPVKPFRQYFTDDGTSTGSNDMKVDGSTTNVEFYIEADQTKDLYIKSVSVVIADASSTLNKFGNITALTNGVEFKWVSIGEEEIVIHEGLVSNFDFVRLAGGQPGFGDGAGAFRASNVESTSEGYIPFIDLAFTFGLPYGIRLKAGSTDKLVFTVRDNCTGVDAFNIIGYGIKI
jgi:hypothetical protein